ncbi:hypothetical protein E2C01_079748 [Portunus trituberculatus]|uniref:Uncharacterized protein n=1 Tax=Portunus trituberculatus TaxID=210409 RepID=A0A5B7IKC2_PORTR|nr:hypothetical protein [Portunus trituberculatus]
MARVWSRSDAPTREGEATHAPPRPPCLRSDSENHAHASHAHPHLPNMRGEHPSSTSSSSSSSSSVSLAKYRYPFRPDTQTHRQTDRLAAANKVNTAEVSYQDDSRPSTRRQWRRECGGGGGGEEGVAATVAIALTVTPDTGAPTSLSSLI